MAQDQKKALDEKTKKLSGGKIEEGKEHQAYQESQQQLLAIQAEQQQNLAVARAESKASFENNQTLAQAAELGAISAAEAEQAAAAGAQAEVQLNPATQQILSKYGTGQPKFQRSQSHSQQVTKQNITINNNITSNTTNDVKVPANIGGPLQGRPLQFKPAAVAAEGGSVGKFKSWISAAFTRQNEEGAKRDREYRNRESSLTKSANRMLKKLEEVGKTIGTRMDPRKIGSTWQSQLKTLLFLFGFGYLTSNWTKILNTVAGIEKWFKTDVAKFFGIGSYKDKESGLKVLIRSILGGKEGESLTDSLKMLLLDEHEGLFGYLKLWLKNAVDERAKAIKLIKFPQLDLDDVIGSIGKIGSYLGDLFSALVGGAEGARKAVGTQIDMAANRGALDAMKNDSGTRETTSAVYDGKKVNADKGLGALFIDPETGKRQHRGLTRYSLDERGELTGSAESTYAQSVHLESAYLDALKGEKAFNTADVSKGIERLYNAAKKKKEEEDHGIPIAKGFLDTLSPKFVDKLKREGKLETVPYHPVVRKKEDIDYIIENADPTAMATKAFANKAILDAIGLGGISDTIASVEGATVGTTTGAIGSAGLGALAGGGTGYLLGGVMNSKWYRGAKEGARGLWNRLTTNDYRTEYERGAGESKEDTVYLLEITPEGIQDIANFLTNGGYFDKIGESQANIDIKDKGFTDSIRSTFTSIADANIKDLKKELNNARAKVKRTGNGFDYTPQQIEGEIIRAERARNGVDDTDRQELYRGLDELNEVVRKHEESEEDYRSNSRFGRIWGYDTRNAPKSQKEYVARIRPLLLKTLKSKSFVPKNKVEEYADLLTAQAALESDWGRSNLSKHNNLSGMTSGTAKNSSGEITIGTRKFATFNSVEDWVDDYVEYLNRKWQAFDNGPSGYLDQIENNPLHKGQKYSGGDPNYKKKVNDILSQLKNSPETINEYEASAIASAAVKASNSRKFYSDSRKAYVDLGVGDYKGLCTSGPATWYEEAGLGNLHNPNIWWNTGSPSTATATNLDKYGFSEIWSGSAEEARKNKMKEVVQPGDVMVSFGNKANGTPSSHAQMWDGTKWLSDTIQNSSFVYHSGRMGNRSAVLYRYGGDKGSSSITGNYKDGYEIPEVTVTGNKGERGEAKSFLEIFKEKVTDLIMNFGGAFSNITDKIEDTILPKEKKRYTGPITKEFKSFNDYKANEDNLPAALPKGMSETEWRKKVIDLTGSMPIDLKLTETAEKTKEEKKTEEPKKELRKDSEEILNKYSKWGENKIPQHKSDFMKDAEDDKYRKLIPYLNDPVLRGQLTADEISNIERVKREDEIINKASAMRSEVMEDPNKYRQLAKLAEDPTYRATLTEDDLEKIKIVQEMDKAKIISTPTLDINEEERNRLIALANDPGTRGMLSPDDLVKVQKIEEAEGKTLAKAPEATPTEEDKALHESSSFLSMIDPKNFEKKEDKIVTIVDLVTNTNDMLGKILSVNSINGTTSAHIVDAVNKNTVTSANASMNLARASFAQQKNSVGKVPSLTETNKSIKELA